MSRFITFGPVVSLNLNLPHRQTTESIDNGMMADIAFCVHPLDGDVCEETFSVHLHTRLDSRSDKGTVCLTLQNPTKPIT